MFAFAGVRSQTGCAIFTTAANELIAPVHDRMPVIIDDPDEEAAWLDPRLDGASAMTLLAALPASRMRAEPASSRVNDLRNDGPELWPPNPAQRRPPCSETDGQSHIATNLSQHLHHATSQMISHRKASARSAPAQTTPSSSRAIRPDTEPA